MTKIMGVRLVAEIRYLKDRLAGRAGLAGGSIVAGYDLAGDGRPAGHPLARVADATRSQVGLWVLPGRQAHTGAEGAEDVRHSIFLPPFCFCSDFGR